jgi:hypothetical protein
MKKAGRMQNDGYLKKIDVDIEALIQKRGGNIMSNLHEISINVMKNV